MKLAQEIINILRKGTIHGSVQQFRDLNITKFIANLKNEKITPKLENRKKKQN